MAASINDKFTETTNGTRPVPTTLTALLASGASPGTATCGALTGWATATAVHFIIYTTDVNGRKVAGSQTDWKGIVSGNTITGLVLKAGTNNGYSIGAVVEAAPTAAWADDVVEGLAVQHNQDGTHKSVTTDTLTATGAVQGATVISTGDIQHRSVSLETIRAAKMFDHIASGCVITGDSLGVNKNYSMTSGVGFINGRYFTIASVAAQTVGASKDRYIYTDNAGTLTNTEVANNATSPTPSANTILIGVVVAGATFIAAAASINQGQEDRVLPIASSIPYTVTDSIGNLICPRDPNRKLLGYRQIIANQSGFTGANTQVVGLSCPVIIPTGRKLKISWVIPNTLPAVSFGTGLFTIWEGTVGSGTQLQLAKQVYTNQDTTISQVYVEAVRTPASTPLTYNAAAGNSGAGGSTTTIQAAATAPSYMKVELE